LKGCGALLLAGGAHATVCPEEPLEQGFDVVLTGEAELGIVALLQALQAGPGGKGLNGVPGAVWRDGQGRVQRGPPAGFIDELDALAPPHAAQPLYAPHWYHPGGATAVPGGLLTSRGCPARCTFCANVVTGRGFRFRSPASVVAELKAWHALTGHSFFPFWDDAFTAKIPRLDALCQAFREDLDFELRFSAIMRAGQVTPALLRQLKGAGLVHVNFGVESGDDEVLRLIKKGLHTEQVLRALHAAKDAGLATACNFMLGFPEDSPASLERTARFMERIAPLVDSFSTLGVVIPFPGTELYEQHHRQQGFTAWWLREDHARWHDAPPLDDAAAFQRHYLDDATLGLDFFHYPAAVQQGIRECLRIKGEHNLRRWGLLRDAVFAPEPLAAAVPAA
jgi:radical SAM superfamily enzyme YgiQ (UPF0313 family)